MSEFEKEVLGMIADLYRHMIILQEEVIKLKKQAGDRKYIRRL